MDRSHNRNYRHWTSIEDAKLVEALVNMVNSGGYKADNGFKSGYLQHLEQALKVSIPESCIMGKPHIESRIKTMKKDWQVVYDMVNGNNTSGFGYDSLKQCVVAEPPVWETYLKVHKEATKWQNKTFPHFEDLCIVFGKDRAQGNRARDIDEMLEEVNMEDQEQQSDDGFGDQEQPNLRNDECSSQRNKKKNRGDPFLDGLTSAVVFLGEKLEKASNNMAKAELDLQNKTSMLTSELAKLNSLSPLEKYKAFRKIARDSELVLNFWALEGEARLDLVKLILED